MDGLLLIRTGHDSRLNQAGIESENQAAPLLVQGASSELTVVPTLEQTVRACRVAGHSQRAIARDLNIDRRKVKRILDQAA